MIFQSEKMSPFYDNLNNIFDFIIKHSIVLIISLVAIFAVYGHSITLLSNSFVYIHEYGHAMLVLMTGGEVISLEVRSNGSGSVFSQHGSSILIYQAGYFIPILYSCMLLYVAIVHRKYIQHMCYISNILFTLPLLANMFGLITLTKFTHTVVFFMTMIIWMLTINLHNKLLILVAIILATYGVGYGLFEIYDDTLRRSFLHSDAFRVSYIFDGTTKQWGMLWMVNSICCVVYTLYKIKQHITHEYTTITD